jgi:hypothetical protein
MQNYEVVRSESSSDYVSSLELTSEDLNMLTDAFKDGCTPQSACVVIDADAEPINVMQVQLCRFTLLLVQKTLRKQQKDFCQVRIMVNSHQNIFCSYSLRSAVQRNI